MSDIKMPPLPDAVEQAKTEYKIFGPTSVEKMLHDYARAAVQANVPDGWVMVPVEPTPKMVDATWDHPVDREGGIESQNKRNKRIWAAMLTASQKEAP